VTTSHLARRRGGLLATRLAVASGLAVLVFAVGLVLASSHLLVAAHDETIGREQSLFALATARDLDAKLHAAKRALERTAAALPATLLEDPLACRRHVEGQVALRELFGDGLTALDARRRVVTATWPAALHVAPDGLPRAPSPGAGALVSTPYPSALAAGEPAVGMEAPIHGADGEVVGWLRGGIALHREPYLGQLVGLRIGREGYFGLVTADRTILLHGDQARVLGSAPAAGVNAAIDRGLAGFDGWLRSRNAQGVEMISAVQHVPSTGWLLVSNYPVSEAHAPFDRVLTGLLAVALAGASILLLTVLLFARRLTHPLAQMTAQVEALVAGRGDVRPVPVVSDDEVGTLAAAFNRLVEERGRAEAELRVSEDRFRRAFQTSPEPMSLSRLDDGVFIAINEGFERLHGVREAEVLGRPGHTLGIWVDPAERKAMVERVKRDGHVRGMDVRVRDGAGQEITIAFSASVVTIAGVPHLFALSRDVTLERQAAREREQLAAALRASEERHRFAVRSVPVIQWAIDAGGRFTLFEGKGATTLGFAAGELLGRSIDEVYRDAPAARDDYRRAAAGESFATLVEIRGATFESHWGPLRDDAGRIVGVTGIALDVTDRLRAERERKETELRLGMVERLAATGQLAAGVAHEINNPLTYLLANLEEAVARLRAAGAEPVVVERLAEALDGAGRVQAIVRDLKVFARAEDEATGSCDAAAVARSAVNLVANEIRHRARLVTRFESAPRAAIAERRLAQVLVNLLVNACKAIPEGRAAEHEIGVAVREEGGRVVVEISDTGVGMTPEVRRRIFEPFFTTRPPGEGMGLGLALSHTMVSEAGGELEVESTPGRGATFRLRLLPGTLADRPAPSPAPAPAALGPGEAPRPRVLIVDDEPLVGRAVARQLGDFEVETETSAAGALRRLRGGAGWDAIVCDLMMPDTSGMDLHAQVAEEAPQVASRFVFLTGGAFTERARTFLATTLQPVLEKPVDPTELRATVRAVASRGRAGGEPD